MTDRATTGQAFVKRCLWYGRSVVGQPRARARLIGEYVAPRWEAGRYLTVMAVCFGLTVVLTRIYLIATGYPKIGGSTYHIAHALFGGLSLVVACVLVLLYANRGVLMACAVFSGIGLGLFIDEIGKFITANNDYFFPLAAPLIYGAFLLVVLVARRAGGSRARTPKALLIEALDGLPAMVGGRMPAPSREALLARLAAVRAGSVRAGAVPDGAGLDDDGVLELARVLESYLLARQAAPGADRASDERGSALAEWLALAENRVAPRRVLRAVLGLVVAVHAVWSIMRLALSAAALSGWPAARGAPVWMLGSGAHGWKSLLAWACVAALEVVTAILYAAATVRWLRGREGAWLRSAIAATVLSLTAVNVLMSYFHQFVTVFVALAEAILLVGLLRYRARFCHVVEGESSP